MAKGKKDKKGAGTDLVPAGDAGGGKKGKGKGKKGGASSSGPKKSKVPRPVQGRGFAWVGLVLLVPIALMLLQDQLTIEAAAKRSLLVLAGVMVVERVIAPLLMVVIDPSRGRLDDDPPATSGAEKNSPASESEPV
jgi:hypothetical protein